MTELASDGHPGSWLNPELNDNPNAPAGMWLLNILDNIRVAHETRDQNTVFTATEEATTSFELFLERMAETHPDVALEFADALDASDNLMNQDLASFTRRIATSSGTEATQASGQIEPVAPPHEE